MGLLNAAASAAAQPAGTRPFTCLGLRPIFRSTAFGLLRTGGTGWVRSLHPLEYHAANTRTSFVLSGAYGLSPGIRQSHKTALAMKKIRGGVERTVGHRPVLSGRIRKTCQRQ